MGDAVNEHASKSYTMVPPPPPPRRRRRVWLHVLLALLILVCGIVIGAGGTVIVVRRAVVGYLHDPGTLSERMAHRMQRRLRLSDKQAEQVEAIFKRRVDALLDIRRDVRPRIAEQLELLKAEMREVLTDEQMRGWENQQLKRIEQILLAPKDDQPTDSP